MSGLDAAILVYAARYALGRRSGAARDVEQAIAANLRVFQEDAGCREALIRDIEAARTRDALGAPVDRSCWDRTLGRLEACRDAGIAEARRGLQANSKQPQTFGEAGDAT